MSQSQYLSTYPCTKQHITHQRVSIFRHFVTNDVMSSGRLPTVHIQVRRGMGQDGFDKLVEVNLKALIEISFIDEEYISSLQVVVVFRRRMDELTDYESFLLSLSSCVGLTSSRLFIHHVIFCFKRTRLLARWHYHHKTTEPTQRRHDLLFREPAPSSMQMVKMRRMVRTRRTVEKDLKLLRVGIIC
jgi:hypothetical protein